MTLRSIVPILATAIVATQSGNAQVPTKSPLTKPMVPLSGTKVIPLGQKKGFKTGIVDMATNIGSFKIVSPGEVKSFGKIDIEFNGSVLIIGLNGTVIPSAGLRNEYSNAKHERTGYNGKGKLTIEGEWTAIQFFGRDMRAHWEGLGICRLYGEFDKNLDTGTFTIKGDKVRAWNQGGNMFVLPRGEDNSPTPRVKKADG